MAENVLDTLRKLYALTAKPEGREEEARTAAWLLIKKAREAGVTIRFVVGGKQEPAEQSTQRAPSPPAPSGAPARSPLACPRCGFPLIQSACIMCGYGIPNAAAAKDPDKCAECGVAKPMHMSGCQVGKEERRKAEAQNVSAGPTPEPFERVFSKCQKCGGRLVTSIWGDINCSTCSFTIKYSRPAPAAPPQYTYWSSDKQDPKPAPNMDDFQDLLRRMGFR